MFKRGIVVFLLCICGLSLFAESNSTKDYPGMNVVMQEIENHQDMSETLEHLMAHLSKSNQLEKSSIESLLNYTNAALIHFEYLDSLWRSVGKRPSHNNNNGVISAKVPCACNGKGICNACGGDGYAWTADPKGEESPCKKCKGSGKNGGFPCSGCQGSGWANSHPNSPAPRK